MGADLKIAVVIPCYRVTDHILEVIAGIGPEVSKIYVVDDACPDASGKFVRENSKDKRLSFITHEVNQGVGGAVVTGYRSALEDGADVVVKIDGDGQMNPKFIPELVSPILFGDADYVKGDRFEDFDSLRQMPPLRLFGNAILSLFSKLSSGYWSITDPTNGFTACHADALRLINLEKLSGGYFFESDMLFRLGLARCLVVDYPMAASYGTEISNLKISRVLWEFPLLHIRNTFKRIAYRYYLREWNLGSLELPAALLMLTLGFSFAANFALRALQLGSTVSAGQVTATAILLILGLQLLLSFLSYDVQSEPRQVRHRRSKMPLKKS